MSEKEEVRPVLVLGASGKTGRRVAEGLAAKGVPVRPGSRAAMPPFDWNDSATWPNAVNNVWAIYIAYYPDLAVPGAQQVLEAFTSFALDMGVRRLVLLSGRGEEEAQAVEQMIIASGADWTFLRCAWFNQNFSEGMFLDGILSGEVALPVGNIGEPFLDVEDVAEIAVKALTEDGHIGRIYELTGPRLLTFAEAIAEIGRASGRDIAYRHMSDADFKAGVDELDLPKDIAWLLKDFLFTRLFDGRNESVTDGVQQVLGCPPHDFTAYAAEMAATGIWNPKA